MYDKETFISAEYIFFSFYMQIYFIYSACLKKIMTPLLDQPKSSEPPPSISNFCMTPHPPTFMPPLPYAAPYLYAASPLEINNDRSLSWKVE